MINDQSALESAPDEQNEEQDCGPHWSPQADELDRGRLNQLNQPRNIRWSLRQEIDPGQLAEELAKRLEHASHILVDRLFAYLSNIPGDESQQSLHNGLTLPASAIGWLSTQMYPRSTNEADSLLESRSEAAWMGASMRDRLALLKYLLPRATHLRITSDIWPPPFYKSSASNPNTDFTGRDLNLSNISLHSGVTMETSFDATTTPSIQSFLLFHNEMQNKPRVDLRVFPNLTVLFLDRIPPEWVVNLRTLHSKLKLIRSERGCIFDMSRFLFGDDDDDDAVDLLSQHGSIMSNLVYLKVNHAALGELSGLRGSRRSKASDDHDGSGTQAYFERPPPLSRLPNLISLSLAHNEIRTVKTALAGLASLSNLNRLDLSYNRLSTMKGANRLLGNIKTLVLTGNSLTKVVGLEKLYSLETLYIDHNRLEDVADIAGLGKLPELMALFVNENPFIEKDPIKYRVSVLDLFKSTRFYSLRHGATYRQLLQLLPVLDGLPATKRELVGLKSLTFRPAIPIATTSTEAGIPETSNRDTQAAPENESTSVVDQLQVTPVVRSRRVTRKARRGRAIVSDGENQDCTQSLKSLSQNRVHLPKVDFSAKDVVETLALSTRKKATNVKKKGSVSLSSCNGQANLSFISLPTGLQDDDSVHNMLSETDMLLAQAQAAIDASVAFDGFEDTANLLDNYSAASYIPQSTPNADLSASAIDQESAPSPSKVSAHFDLVPTSQVEPKHRSTASWFSTTTASIEDQAPPGGTGSQGQNTSLNPFDDEPHQATGSPSRNLEFDLFSPTTDADFLPRPRISFPEGVWDDTASVASSLGTGRHSLDIFASESKYYEAENTTVYDGPEGYKKLSVVVNLELYFRLYVFPSTDSFANSRHELDDELSKRAIEASPRIQLRPIDRKVAEETTKNSLGSAKSANFRETFKKVWQEEIIACGKSAARRLAPHKKLRRGFHGDPIFRDGSISFATECRRIILCTSDVAIYLIPDYDPVSMKFVESNAERKFPSPIPHEALFQNGIWPHALARLPIETLKRITIGFSFQRLILHFSPSSAVEKSVLGNCLTFILATSNRMATVRLLQHLQDLTKVTDELSTGKQQRDVIIDNEDKQVLDSLSVAVAPVPIDVVLHYQVLQQRWKNGDRGTVRRACVITDSHIFLLDEDYVGDGSESYEGGSRSLAEVRYNLIDSAELSDIVEVQAARVDPKEITIVIRPQSSFQRNHNWRLFCRDGGGAERLVDDARKAMSSVAR